MIFNKLFNLPNQTTQPGTVQNITSRFHHNKASKNVANFFACWDVMEVCTVSNLVALAMEISGLPYREDTTEFTEAHFHHLVDTIFDNINNFQKWNRKGMNIQSRSILTLQLLK